MVNHEWSSDELRHKAEAYCAGAEHCSAELSNKLHQWGASTDEIGKIIQYLKDARYIDEERYCRAFVHDKVLYQGWGRNKIKATLFAKHLPTSLINQAIAEINESEYLNTLQRVIVSKKHAIKPNDPMAREKLIRFCFQRGFTYDEIEDLV